MTRFANLASLALLLAGCQDPAAVAPSAAPTAPPEDAAPRVLAVPAGDLPEAPAQVGVETPDEAAAPAAEPLLVWGRDADGGTFSWWLEADGLGGWQVMEAEGVYVAAGDGLWRWTTATEPLPLGMDCELFDRGDQPPFGDTDRTGTGTRAVLERLGADGEARVVLEPGYEGAFDAADYGENVVLEGSVGPVLFVHRSAWSYSCGAHGGEMHSFLAFDAATGEATSLYHPDSVQSLTERLRPAGWAALEGEMPFADGPGDLSLTLQRPVFAEDGTLAIEHQLTVGTCYACSDGNWDSYTVSARVRDEAIPAALVPHVDYPAEAVRWLDEQVEGLDLRGVSQPSPDLRPVFEEQQVPGC